MRYIEKRFIFFGKFFIFRLRKHKTRPLEITNGTSFKGLHWHKVSLLCELNKPQRKLSDKFACTR